MTRDQVTSSLATRIRWLRFGLAPILVVVVVLYQLGVAQSLERAYGHTIHYAVEIGFYSLVGPIVLWFTLVWVERALREKEHLEARIQAVERERAAVVEEERARISRDLHDSAAQTLYFLALKTDALRHEADIPPEVVTELNEMGKQTRQTIREIRQTIFALQPLPWPSGRFLTGLTEFVHEYATHAGWQVELQLKAPAPPAALEPVLFRVVQESLNNVAKHAAATRVTLALTKEVDGSFRLTIVDDGAGLAEGAGVRRGLGLKQMAARVEAAAGTFTIANQALGGVAVEVVLPPGVDPDA